MEFNGFKLGDNVIVQFDYGYDIPPLENCTVVAYKAWYYNLPSNPNQRPSIFVKDNDSKKEPYELVVHADGRFTGIGTGMQVFLTEKKRFSE